jgi:hypothetical protein
MHQHAWLLHWKTNVPQWKRSATFNFVMTPYTIAGMLRSLITEHPHILLTEVTNGTVIALTAEQFLECRYKSVTVAVTYYQ